MFSIYKFMYDNGMCDKSYLLSCVPDAGLSQAEYDQIVGDDNAEREAQPTAQDQPPTTCNFGRCYDWYWLNSCM